MCRKCRLDARSTRGLSQGLGCLYYYRCISFRTLLMDLANLLYLLNMSCMSYVFTPCPRPGVAASGQVIQTRPFQLVTGRVWKGSAFGGAYIFSSSFSSFAFYLAPLASPLPSSLIFFYPLPLISAPKFFFPLSSSTICNLSISYRCEGAI